LAHKLSLGTGNVGKSSPTAPPLFFTINGPDAASRQNMNTGFEVRSMLTVPLRTNVVNGRSRRSTKNQRRASTARSPSRISPCSRRSPNTPHPLISRRLDPNFPPSTEDTAKLVSRLTDPSLATKQVKIEIDDKLVEIVGDAVIRREAVFPHKRLSSNSVAVLLVNPLDYAPQVFPAGHGAHDRGNSCRSGDVE
jgi:type IV pilus assembly protein PilB